MKWRSQTNSPSICIYLRAGWLSWLQQVGLFTDAATHSPIQSILLTKIVPQWPRSKNSNIKGWTLKLNCGKPKWLCHRPSVSGHWLYPSVCTSSPGGVAVLSPHCGQSHCPCRGWEVLKMISLPAWSFCAGWQIYDDIRSTSICTNAMAPWNCWPRLVYTLMKNRPSGDKVGKNRCPVPQTHPDLKHIHVCLYLPLTCFKWLCRLMRLMKNCLWACVAWTFGPPQVFNLT